MFGVGTIVAAFAPVGNRSLWKDGFENDEVASMNLVHTCRPRASEASYGAGLTSSGSTLAAIGLPGEAAFLDRLLTGRTGS